MVKYTDTELKDWWVGKARSVEGYRKNILNNVERANDYTVIGKMYFFKYDPKLKKTLPIYDIYPLVFPIEPYQDGFLGLNLHYLSGGERGLLVSKLREFSNNNKNNKTTRLRLSYDLLAGTKKLASDTRPCIKRYLFSQVRSSFMEITANEWDKVVELPLELFVRKG